MWYQDFSRFFKIFAGFGKVSFYFHNIDVQIDEASGQIDFAQFKEAAIRSCTLSDDLKDAALATFDQCTTAAVPSPYFSLHFQRQNVPGSVLLHYSQAS